MAKGSRGGELFRRAQAAETRNLENVWGKDKDRQQPENRADSATRVGDGSVLRVSMEDRLASQRKPEEPRAEA